MTGIDLFKEYLIERDGRFIIYDEDKMGFIVYSFPQRNADECFVDDLFVVDHARSLKKLLELLDKVREQCRIREKKILSGAVNLEKPDVERILKAHLWYGMKPFLAQQPFIYTAKELK